MSKYRFKSKCPSCTNNETITWHHCGCPDSYKEFIDEYGYVTCDCNKGSNIIFRKFNCGRHHNDEYLPFLGSRIYVIMAVAGTMNDDIPESWRLSFMDNVKKKWDKEHPR